MPHRTPVARRTPLLVAAALSLAGAACTAGASGPAARPPVAATPSVVIPTATAPVTSDPLRQPVEVRSVPQAVWNAAAGRMDTIGILDATLQVVYVPLAIDTSATGSATEMLRAWRLVSANVTPFSSQPTSYDVTAYPGPTFRVNPGDSVRILLQNMLPDTGRAANNDVCEVYAAASSQNPTPDTMQDCFHGFNLTNIHYHGFHVTPEWTGDNVLLTIAPDSSFQYAFRIPENQSPGTHWYHPHKHGSVAIQVSNGMSGAFIVGDGAMDRMLDSMHVQEKLIAIQRVSPELNLMGGGPSATLINGQYRPVIQMYPGEVQRWRIVNENITKDTNYRIAFNLDPGVSGDTTRPRMYDVARDGVQFAPANFRRDVPDASIVMAPGNRLDVLVKAPSGVGLHTLSGQNVAARPDDGRLQSIRERFGAAAAAKELSADTLFYVEVIPGPAQATSLPAALPPLPAFLQNLPGPVVGLDSILADTASMPNIVFYDVGRQGNASSPPRFYLGTAQDMTMQFNDTVFYTPQTSSGTAAPMRLGQVQTWKVSNYGTRTNHPFHIHINPFQVLYVHAPSPSDSVQALYEEMNAAARAGNPYWLDVVPLPLPLTDASGNVTDPGYVIIRQAYEDFTGAFVMHCHILGHEERGMMQLIQVVPPGVTPAATRESDHGHAHH